MLTIPCFFLFAKHRLRKYRFDIPRNDIKWPERYVVLSAIAVRLRRHRLRKDTADAASARDDITKIIAPNLETPRQGK